MSDRMNRSSGYRPSAAAGNKPRPVVEAKVAIVREGLLESFPIAMTYTPMQRWCETYCAQKALERGTLFPPLDLPFAGRRC